jgi:plasmid stability protein
MRSEKSAEAKNMNLTIRDLPDELVVSLTRRAKTSGRTVEQEALGLLHDAIEPRTTSLSNEPFATSVARRIAEVGLTVEDWQELDSSLDAARSARGDSIHRWIDFNGLDFGK